MTADLHLHTIYSDGSFTPAELVEKALEQGLSCIAVTDHDCVDGLAEARSAACGRLEVIPGIEINSVDDTECGAERDVHILGHFIDPCHRQLTALIQKQQDARHQLVDDVISKCRSLGIPLTHQQVEDCAGQGSIGRPHLARAIVLAGGAESIGEAFSRFMSRHSVDFVPRRAVRPIDAIAAITTAGGVAAVAHPGRHKDMESIILRLQQRGLEAVEAYHRSHSLELVKHYLRFAATNNLLVTGGSDCHGNANGNTPSIGTVKVPLDVVRNLRKRRALAHSSLSI